MIAGRIEDIERLRYLGNARKAAGYYGCSTAEVMAVWGKIRPTRKIHSGKISYSADVKAGGVDYRQTIADDARTGSANLRRAMIEAMLRWADCNGTTLDDAARFLMSGRR